MSTFYTNIPAKKGSTFCGTPSSRVASDDVEAFIWRCRQDGDRNVRGEQVMGGRGDLDSGTAATFLQMLTDVNTKCTAMEEQLRDLQAHAQRVASQLDSLTSSRGPRQPHGSASSTISAGAYTIKAIRKLQWKIFDLQRENEALRAVLEMQRTEAGTQEATEDTQDAEETKVKDGSAWDRLGMSSQETSDAGNGQMMGNETPSGSASTVVVDTRIVHLVDPKEQRHPQRQVDQQPGSGSDKEAANGYSQTQSSASGLHTKCTDHPQPSQADRRFVHRVASGCQYELKPAVSDGGVQSTPARDPKSKSPPITKSRSGNRQPWKWSSHQSQLFPQLQPHKTSQGGQPLDHSTPKTSTRDANRQQDSSQAAPSEFKSTVSEEWQEWDPWKENLKDWDMNMCSGELGDTRLQEFNLYATPEDIQLVRGTLELLRSINNLEFAGGSK